jgi:micrococcal nuclease
MAAGWLIFKPPVAPDRAVVLHVVDGDTLKVEYQGRAERIRLIGIDTPESAPNSKARRNARRSRQKIKAIIRLGQEAKTYVQTLVRPGDSLRLEFDAERLDAYGRLLAYVYLPDGRMLNEVIIRSGYAQPLTIPPNLKYQALFLDACRKARDEHAGLWKE